MSWKQATAAKLPSWWAMHGNAVDWDFVCCAHCWASPSKAGSVTRIPTCLPTITGCARLPASWDVNCAPTRKHRSCCKSRRPSDYRAAQLSARFSTVPETTGVSRRTAARPDSTHPFSASEGMGRGSAHHEWIAGLDPGIDPDALHLQVFVNGVLAVFPAHAAVLVAAERRHEADGAIGVDPYSAGLDAFRHAYRTTYVARPHPRTEPEADVVGDAHGILLILERDNGEHGAEYLFLRNAHPVVHAGENRRLDEPSLAALRTRRRAATHAQLRPLVLGDIDVREHFLILRLRGHRADLGFQAHRVAHFL